MQWLHTFPYPHGQIPEGRGPGFAPSGGEAPSVHRAGDFQVTGFPPAPACNHCAMRRQIRLWGEPRRRKKDISRLARRQTTLLEGPAQKRRWFAPRPRTGLPAKPAVGTRSHRIKKDGSGQPPQGQLGHQARRRPGERGVKPQTTDNFPRFGRRRVWAPRGIDLDRSQKKKNRSTSRPLMDC